MNRFSQIPLPLSYRTAYDREDFLVAPCNEEAVTWIDAYPGWAHSFLLLIGEEGSGKTHLATVFSKNIYLAKDLTLNNIPVLPEKFVVEDIDENADEDILFHLFNYVLQNGRTALLTAKALPLFKKADLKTRISTVPIVKIHAPDDMLMMSLLYKGFKERQVEIEGDVLEYLLKHLDRSFKAIQDLIEKADRLSLSQKKALTIPLIKQALSEMNAEKLL